jgi:pimeloyl-ACP methyl ester carboxylesterase
MAEALAAMFTVHLWDMPGYGLSSKLPDHDVSLDVQGELFAALLAHWELESPHVVAHDYGGAVALRANLLHERRFSSLVLVDVVALAPWGSDFFRLVRDHADVCSALPRAIHEGALRAYIASASHIGISPMAMESLVAPWVDGPGQAAFYRQIAQADQAYTDEIQDLYAGLKMPVLVVWGDQDAWIPVDRAHRLCELIPGAQLKLIKEAGHLIQLDQPTALATTLTAWLLGSGTQH